MAEYIEREKVYETLNAALNETDKLNGLFSQDYIRGCRNTLGMVIDDIQKIPAADVRPERHGGWVFSEKLETLGMTIYKCSECGGELSPSRAEKSEWINNPRYAYCSYCSAKMDVKDD